LTKTLAKHKVSLLVNDNAAECAVLFLKKKWNYIRWP